jgi:cytochrome c553
MKWLWLSLALLLAGPALAAGTGAESLYAARCAECHGSDRLGGSGPALLPSNLGRLKPAKAATVISEGRVQTQMPGYGTELSAADIEALVAYIYEPPAVTPVWGSEEILLSYSLLAEPGSLGADPVYKADMLNLFVVVESGDHHVTILDGDTFEPIHRFASRYALHGGPKFSPDGRFVYFASRDGWIAKYDLYSLTLVAETRAGINTRNLAISGDGKVLAVANYLPQSLVMLDAEDLTLLKVIPVTDMHNKHGSRVSAVYQAAPRESFIVALKDVPEMWEVPYSENPPLVVSGLAHSNETGMEEVLPAAVDRFPIRRIELTRPLDDFFFSQDYRHVFGSAREGGKAVVVHLDVRQEIAEVPIPGLPHLGSGITWTWQGRRVMATPNLREAAVSVIAMDDWSVVGVISTLGPGFFMRSHENSPYAWTDVFFGPERDVMHVIDKATLEVVATLRPSPGKTSGHVEFTRDGSFALVSIWDMDGALVIYDAATLEEVKRIPMVKPSGKYNVFNKINRSEGTSH